MMQVLAFIFTTILARQQQRNAIKNSTYQVKLSGGKLKSLKFI